MSSETFPATSTPQPAAKPIVLARGYESIGGMYKPAGTDDAVLADEYPVLLAFSSRGRLFGHKPDGGWTLWKLNEVGVVGAVVATGKLDAYYPEMAAFTDGSMRMFGVRPADPRRFVSWSLSDDGPADRREYGPFPRDLGRPIPFQDSGNGGILWWTESGYCTTELRPDKPTIIAERQWSGTDPVNVVYQRDSKTYWLSHRDNGEWLLMTVGRTGTTYVADGKLDGYYPLLVLIPGRDNDSLLGQRADGRWQYMRLSLSNDELARSKAERSWTVRYGDPTETWVPWSTYCQLGKPYSINTTGQFDVQFTRGFATYRGVVLFRPGTAAPTSGWRVQRLATTGAPGATLGTGDSSLPMPVAFAVDVGGSACLFTHHEDGSWRVRPASASAGLAAASVSGTLPGFFPQAFAYTAGTSRYFFFASKDGAWQTRAQQADGSPSPTVARSGQLPYPSTTVFPYTVDGRTYCHGLAGGSRWFIRELKADGSLGDETASALLPQPAIACPFVDAGAPHVLYMEAQAGWYTFRLPAGGAAPVQVEFGSHRDPSNSFDTIAKVVPFAIGARSCFLLLFASGNFAAYEYQGAGLRWRRLAVGTGGKGYLTATTLPVDGGVALFASAAVGDVAPLVTTESTPDAAYAVQATVRAAAQAAAEKEWNAHLVREAEAKAAAALALAKARRDAGERAFTSIAANRTLWLALGEGAGRNPRVVLDDVQSVVDARFGTCSRMKGRGVACPNMKPPVCFTLTAWIRVPTPTNDTTTCIIDFGARSYGRIVARIAAEWTHIAIVGWSLPTPDVQTVLYVNGVRQDDEAPIAYSPAGGLRIGLKCDLAQVMLFDCELPAEQIKQVMTESGAIATNDGNIIPAPGAVAAPLPASAPAPAPATPAAASTPAGSATTKPAELAEIGVPKVSMFGVEIDVPFEFHGEIKEEVRDAQSWSGRGKLLWPIDVTVDPLAVSVWKTTVKDEKGKDTWKPVAAVKFGLPKSTALSQLFDREIKQKMPSELAAVTDTILRPYIALFNNSTIILATDKGVDTACGPFLKGFNMYATVKVSDIQPLNYVHDCFPSLGLDTCSLKFNMSTTPSPVELSVGGTLTLNKRLDPLPLTIVSLGIKASQSTTSSDLGATCAYTLQVLGETIKFAGGVSIKAGAKGNTATLWGSLAPDGTGPVKAWKEPFGIKYLVIDEMGIEVSNAPARLGVRGGWHFGGGLAGSDLPILGGSIAFLIDTGAPNNNMLELRSQEGLQLPRLIKAMTGGYLDVSKVLAINITDLYLYYAKEHVKIAGKAYEPGMGLSCKLDLWGFKAFIDGKFDDKGKGYLKGSIDPIALSWGGFDLVKLTSVDGKTGAFVDITADLPTSFKGNIDGQFSALGGLFKSSTKVVLDDKGFAATLASNGLFSQSALQLRVGPDGATLKYGHSWGPDITVMGYRFNLTVGAAIETWLSLQTFKQRVTFTFSFMNNDFSVGFDYGARPIDGIDALKACWDSATDVGGQLTSFLAANVEMAVQWLKDTAKMAYDQISRTLVSAGAAIESVAKSVVEFFEVGADDVLKAVNVGIDVAARVLKNAFNYAVDMAVQCLDFLGHAKEAIANVLAEVGYAVTEVGAAIADFFGDLFSGEESGHGTFTTRLLWGGTLEDGDTMFEKWKNFWPQLASYTVNGKTYCFEHRDGGDGAWCVQEFYRDGKMSSGNYGKFGSYFPVVVPFSRAGGTDCLFMQNGLGFYQIRAIEGNGAPANTILDSGSISALVPASSTPVPDMTQYGVNMYLNHTGAASVTFDSGKTALIAYNQTGLMRMFELNSGKLGKLREQKAVNDVPASTYDSLKVAVVRGDRFLIASSGLVVDVYGPLNENTLNLTRAYRLRCGAIEFKAAFPFSVGGKTFVLVHNRNKMVYIYRLFSNGQLESTPCHTETYNNTYERMLAYNVGGMVFCFGHNADT